MLVNRQVYAVPLRVARTFYVNSSLPPDDPVAVALGRRVVRTLPYGQEPFNIYQVRAKIVGPVVLTADNSRPLGTGQ